MTVWDYPMGFGYGAQDGYYYGPNGIIGPYHRGDDWFAPVGSEVTINGVVIGLSGSTGNVSGPHTHVGHFIGGQDVNPNLGGRSVVGAEVISTGEDSTNGKYVRVRAGDGSIWVYLHLSKILVKNGDKLDKEKSMITQGQLDKLIKMAKRAEPNATELSDTNWMNDPGLAIDTMWSVWGAANYEEDKKPKEYVKVDDLFVRKG